RQSNLARVGQIVDVTLESTDQDGIFYVGRSYGEAPDVDPVIYVAARAYGLQIGQTIPVRLVDAGDYDLTGVTLDESSE
ncbi:MAG: 30S ribosomal protein S12 methylthiotransferase RimO, partial [Eubacteriales bacterium]|nr:30S ribosomal protein S12 methylthiotransferase RimO [Eubacteriales bacterium]